MARRKSAYSKGSVTLPWERRGAWARRLLAGPRWKILLVLGLLVWGASATYGFAQARAKERVTLLAIGEVHRAIRKFRSEMGRCPRSMTELVHPPRSRRRYLREAPRDGWGRTLWVRCPGHDDPDAADVISSGPSGSFLVDDNLH
ncbi:MAG: type II secretion system protein GspG [Myxococcales bacterium]|nr:type II secretion system protein GspG [Myxococcales bacterium]